jgi:putative transcriptional regulator
MKAVALLATLALAAPLHGHEPAIGRFLIATRQVSGFFAESVIVLVDHGDHGSLGLIVNRPLERSLAELLPDLEGAAGHDEPAFFGGPVAPRQILLLVRSARPPSGTAPVLDGVAVSGSRDTLRSWLEAPPAGSELRAYAGYAGWTSGQLAAEIARGDWLVATGDAAAVFTRDPAGLWDELLKKHQAIEVEVVPPTPHVFAGGLPPRHRGAPAVTTPALRAPVHAARIR